MKKNVLVKVYDTEGLADFIKELNKKYDCTIFAGEENEEFLNSNGIKTKCLDEFSAEYNPDILICNFFPVEKYENKNVDTDEFLENTDAEMITLLTIAVKNYKNTLIVSSKDSYKEVSERISKGEIDEEYLFSLAQDALAQMAKYNAELVSVISGNKNLFILSGIKQGDLKYGENPHQKAELYANQQIDYEVLQGNQLSYNNVLDMNLSLSIVSEFYDVCAAAIVKHSMPCGVALGSSISVALQNAIDCEPMSSFGGTVAFTREIDEKLAKSLDSLMFEAIIAPDFSEKALELLKGKDVRIIKINTPLKDYRNYVTKEIKVTPFGILVQEADKSQLEKDTFKVVSKKKPTTEMVEDMIFAWKVAKHTRSSSAVIAKGLKTVGICQGKTLSIDAVEKALDLACENSKDAILATDGTIVHKNIIQAAIQGRIACIIQPGGREKEIVKLADKYEIVMIETGIRQYRNQ